MRVRDPGLHDRERALSAAAATAVQPAPRAAASEASADRLDVPRRDEVVGGNSIANVTSVTPGGVGVNQAFNVASLREVTDATTATAYSVAQQLITTAWNILFAIVMMIWAFGWTGGRLLVTQSYGSEEQSGRAVRLTQGEERQARSEEGGRDA